MEARLPWFRVLLAAVLFALGTGTTTADALTFSCDVLTVARFENPQIEEGEAAPALPGEARGGSPVLAVEEARTSTTLAHSFVATEAVNVVPSSGKTFVATPRGTVYGVPEGWAHRVSDNGKGSVYQ